MIKRMIKRIKNRKRNIFCSNCLSFMFRGTKFSNHFCSEKCVIEYSNKCKHCKIIDLRKYKSRKVDFIYLCKILEKCDKVLNSKCKYENIQEKCFNYSEQTASEFMEEK